MKGSNLRRAMRLMSYLSSHPSEIARYFRESIGNQTPISLHLPWISYAAITYLENYLTKNHRIAEFGGGGSTLFFAKRAQSVFCIESNPIWAERISEELKRMQLGNVTIKVLPYDAQDLPAYERSEHLSAIQNDFYEVILIDGYEENVELRPTCFWRAEEQVCKGGLIVVDDSWRYPIIRKKNKALAWKTFQSTGPCRPGITTTDIFFY